FENIDKIASGDDMLLMHKIWKRFPVRVHYLKSRQAIVATQPMKTWKEFFNQRIRWASKTRFYDDMRIFWVLLLVYLFNFSFLVLPIARCLLLIARCLLPIAHCYITSLNDIDLLLLSKGCVAQAKKKQRSDVWFDRN